MSLSCLWACKRSTESVARSRDLTLAPQGSASIPTTPPQVLVPAPGHCLPVMPASVRLTGILEETHRLGPPGYGETPEKDAVLTIYVLHLTEPVDVCASRIANIPRPAVSGVAMIQLNGVPDAATVRRHVGERMSVYGRLDRKTWASDFTEVTLWVDSIPDRRATRSAPITALGGSRVRQFDVTPENRPE